MSESRPDPDALLARIQQESQTDRRGRLKLFLGYAAGVGKTYAMLEAAHRARSDGRDVAAAYIETHGRRETEALLQGLEVTPRREVEYRGIRLAEMDLQAALQRRPQVALVDELAHTNAPESLHPKRYQDVEDLLNAGIDVYATLNVQHIESLNDVVAQITSIRVAETIPDWVVDSATEIELVDLPPDELLQRLREGKVYIPDQAARAIEQFFRKGNLTALREMSMRRAAERVERQMRSYMREKAIPGPWAAGERLMVCIGPGPMGERLVRSTRRLAGELNCEWLAVYVETPAHARLSARERDRIFQTLQRAEELGAKTKTMTGEQAHREILAYARRHNVTRIIVGKSPQAAWRDWFGESIVDKLIRESGTIDVFVVNGEPEPSAAVPVRRWIPHRPWTRYALAALVVGVATLLSLPLRGLMAPTNLAMLFLLAVVIAAVTWGRGPSIFAALLGVAAFDFFCVPPYYTMAVSATEYLITFGALFIVSLVISELATRLRDQVESANRRQAETASLYGLSRDLAAAEGMESILQAVTDNIEQTFDRDAAIFLPDEAGKLRPIQSRGNFHAGETEQALAAWAFEHSQAAGRGTETLPAAQARYLPLRTARASVGVLAVRPHDPNRHLPIEGYRLLEAFASQAALAIERAQLGEQARLAQLLQATENLQSALLNSLSHNLRTPLVSITGALTSLEEQAGELSEEDRRSLVATARGEANRMNRLVGNLLSMTRIEGGALYLQRQPEDLQDVVGAALDQLGKTLAEHPVHTHIPEGFPLIPMDFGLMAQTMANLLDNAAKYSPEGSSIELSAGEDGSTAHIEICDHGIGIPAEDAERVFEKFYRVDRPGQASGSGLGLSICKGIIDAHGGRIRATPRAGGGSVLTIELPLSE